MKSFWEKTKQQVTLGVASVKEATGNEVVQETPEFIQLSGSFKESVKKLENIRNSIANYCKYIEKMTTAQYTLSGQIAQLFKVDEPMYSVANASHQKQEAVYTSGRNMATFYLQKQLMDQVKKLMEELGPINQAIEKRHRNHVLLNAAEKDLEKAKDKGKVKDIGELQDNITKRRAKFSQYDAEFTRLANDFLAKAPAEYAKIFNAFQYYTAEFYDLGRKKVIEEVPGFNYPSLKGEYTSITVIPPVQQSAPSYV